MELHRKSWHIISPLKIGFSTSFLQEFKANRIMLLAFLLFLSRLGFLDRMIYGLGMLLWFCSLPSSLPLSLSYLFLFSSFSYILSPSFLTIPLLSLTLIYLLSSFSLCIIIPPLFLSHSLISLTLLYWYLHS